MNEDSILVWVGENPIPVSLELVNQIIDSLIPKDFPLPSGVRPTIQECIARAIIQEREACAKIADSLTFRYYERSLFEKDSEVIARRIRARK